MHQNTIKWKEASLFVLTDHVLSVDQVIFSQITMIDGVAGNVAIQYLRGKGLLKEKLLEELLENVLKPCRVCFDLTIQENINLDNNFFLHKSFFILKNFRFQLENIGEINGKILFRHRKHSTYFWCRDS